MTTEHAPTANMTLDERQEFEKLLAEYANAEMDVARSTGRRHNAMHACIDFINTRTNAEIREAYNVGVDHGKSFVDGTYKSTAPAPIVLVDAAEGRTLEVPPAAFIIPPGTGRKLRPILETDAVRGKSHLKGTTGLPVEDCACSTCCEARVLHAIHAPILDVSGGN